MSKKKAKNEVSSANENKNKNEETKKKSKEDKKVIEVKEKPKIFHLDFKSLRNVLQQILNKINSLMLPLIKNCRSDKVQMSLYSPNIHSRRVFRLDTLISPGCHVPELPGHRYRGWTGLMGGVRRPEGGEHQD